MALLVSLSILLLVLALIMWQGKRERPNLDQPSIFVSYDTYLQQLKENNLKKKFEKPKAADVVKLICLLSMLYGYFLWFNDNFTIWHVLLAEFIIVMLAIIIYYTILIPSYYNLFAENFPNNLRLFAQEISAGTDIRSAMLKTKDYAHPEMMEACLAIAKLIDIGLNLEQAVLKVLPKIKPENLLLFLAVLIVHDKTGGRLALVLNNLSALFAKQFALNSKVAKITIKARISLYFALFYYPVILLLLYFTKPEVFRLLLDDPIGWFWHKVIIFLYVTSSLICSYLLRKKGL